MTNQHLFGLINATQSASGFSLEAAAFVAEWLILIVPIAMIAFWLRGDHETRRELLQMLLSVLLALVIAQGVAFFWPQPRPAALHLGHQYLSHVMDPGLPSDHVTIFWSLALSALLTRRYASLGLLTLAMGLLVGWSRVYLGVHFPLDVAAALPVAACGALSAWALRARTMTPFMKLINLYDRLERRVLKRDDRSQSS